MEEILRNLCLSVSIFLFCLILVPQLSEAQNNVPPFQCPEPNFLNQGGDLYGGCNDILNGERVLLAVDDLAIGQVYTDGGSFSTNIFLLNTDNNTISSQSTAQIAAGAPLDSGFHGLEFGRFVNSDVFATEPNASQGLVIGPNDNSSGNFCPKSGAGEFLVMNFFRSGGQFDCGAIPTALAFSATENTAMVWSTVVADFNKDGLDDIFVNYLPDGGYRIFSFENVDSEDFTADMSASAEATGLFLVDATAGDFDGDGQLEIAGVQDNNGTVQLVILELTYDGNGNVSGFMAPTLIDNTFINMDIGIEPGKTIGITSGDFDPTNPFTDELVVAATLNTEFSQISATLVAFGLNLAASCTPGTTCSGAGACSCITNLTPTRVDVTQGTGITRPSTPIRLKTKRTLSGPDIAVFGVNSPLETGTFFSISVLKFAGTGSNPLNFSLISYEDMTEEGLICLHDVAIGNFDPDGDNNPDLMVAALYADSDFLECSNIIVLGGAGSGSNPRVAFYEIGQTALTQTSIVEVGGFTNGQTLPVINNVTSYMNLQAGDLQGRSLLLGDPTKVVVNNHLQPSVVIKSPPMHVTTLMPPSGSVNNVNPSDNTVIGNIITAFPELFNAEFGINTATSQTFNQNSTTGYTLSTQQGTEDSVSYGVPDDTAVTAKFSETAQQVHDNSVSNKYNRYMDLMQGQTLGQRFDDEMMSSQSRQNIWSYPILGSNGVECAICETAAACPGISGCPVGEAPVTINISAPDMITVAVGSTVNLEWYQPPEVPGNVLTYPWTLAQLEQQFPGFLPLSDVTPEIEITGTTDSPVTVSWTVKNSNSTGYDSSVQHSYNTSLSISANAEIIPGFGVDAEADFEYNSSTSFSTLYESESTGSLTDGFTINKNSVPNSSLIQYPFRYYIFGQSPAQGTFQEQTMSANTFPVTGPLFLGFEANPASSSEQTPAGPWWFNTYRNNNPDIALNLPAQWDWITDESEPDDPKQFRFLKRSGANGLFYFMKSFFAIPTEGTSNTCPSSVPGSAAFEFGPQQTIFEDGDDVLLCLRVYNLSLSSFPRGSEPKVRIYRREWDHNTGNFVSGSDSILVDEISINPIPKAGAESFGDQNSSTAPNWVYAGTVLDTEGISPDNDTYWKFWAVTWIEDSSGELQQELPDLGLNSIPQASVNTHSAINVEPFSNNVGLYNQVYKITRPSINGPRPTPEPPTDPGPIDTDPGPIDTDPGPIDIGIRGVGDPIFIQSLNAIPVNVVPGDRAQLDLIVNNFDVFAHNALILYYDGDPELDGKLFDIEFLPKVPSQDTFRVKNSYLPRSCGTHNLFVKMLADDGSSDIEIVNIKRECTELSINEAVYTPSLNQLIVQGTAKGVLRGSDIKLFSSTNFSSPLDVLSEEDLGINGGIRTFSFTVNNVPQGDLPCIVRVVTGQVVDQRQILGTSGDCVIDDEEPTTQPRPTPAPEPTPAPPTEPPIATPMPGEGPINPDDDNVADVEGVFIISPQGTLLGDAARVVPECPDEINGEFLEYPLGFFTFEVTNINPGESVEVSLLLPEGTQEVNSYFKFGPTPDNPEPHCYDFSFDGTTGAQILGNGEIMITFVDGLRGDSDLTVNGVITDPGGPVVREFENPQVGVGDCSLARGPQPPSALVSLLIPLLAGLFAGIRILRRKKMDSESAQN